MPLGDSETINSALKELNIGLNGLIGLEFSSTTRKIKDNALISRRCESS